MWSSNMPSSNLATIIGQKFAVPQKQLRSKGILGTFLLSAAICFLKKWIYITLFLHLD